MKWKRGGMTCLAMVLGMVSMHGSMTGREIMERSYDRPDGKDLACEMRMTLRNRRGQERIREMKIYGKEYGEDEKALTYFMEPADVRGTGFLNYDYDDPEREDDRWLYLPALRKSKRISGSADNDRFMGSDFTYKDWGGRDLDEDRHELLRTEVLDGDSCWVVESVPVDPSDPYGKLITWISEDTLVEKRIEFYDRKGELLKVFELLELKKIDGYWTPVSFGMKDIRKSHETLIEQSEIRYDTGLKDSLFRVSTLERGMVR